MAEYEEQHQLDYRSGGDTVDDFAQKYMAEITRVFRFLNDLRANKTNNIEYTEPTSGQWKVEDNKVYMRNSDNTEWVYILDVANHGGFKTDTIGTMASGSATDLPATGSNYDIFYDTTNERMYMWLGGEWKMQSSRNVADLTGYSNLLQTSDIGTDSGDIVTYSADNEITTKAGYKVLTTNNVGTSEGKVPAINENGKLPVDITGNAGKIAGYNAEVNNIQDGQVLTYRVASGTWRNEDKGVVGAGKALAVYDDSRLMFEYDGDRPEGLHISDWKGYDFVPTPTFDDTFTVDGDVTDFYTVGRTVEVEYSDETEDATTTIASVSYDNVTDKTTVEVADEGAITANTKYVVYNPTAETYANKTEIASTYATKTEVATDLALKAPLASPALTGNPTAPTQEAGDNSTKIATTAYVDTAVNNIQGHYVGEFVAMSCTADYVPEGCVPADGTEYSATQFPTLWESYLTADTPLLPTCSYADYASEIASKGQCNKWAVDTVSEKFKVPLVKDGSFLQQALSNSELGKCYSAGLPNITGEFRSAYCSVHQGNGAFSTSGSGVIPSNYQSLSSVQEVADFDASRSSAIYGNSSTVQPNAVTVRFFVCVASGSVNQSMMDWSAYMSALQGKADKDRVYDLYDDFTIIYPNGGTESNPANITNNSRYVEANPFVGYYVKCIAEIYTVADGWHEAMFQTYGAAPTSRGTGATQNDTGNIIVQTGFDNIRNDASNQTGGSWTDTTLITTAPCRVKVWKIGKVVPA